MKGTQGFTFVEIMVVVIIIAFVVVAWARPTLQDVYKQSKVAVVRQQAKAIQDALDSWLQDQALSDSRTLFNSSPSATAPADQAAFFNSQLAQFINVEMAADITANSTTTQLRSTAMNYINAYITISWDTNYTQSHPKANLVIP